VIRTNQVIYNMNFLFDVRPRIPVRRVI